MDHSGYKDLCTSLSCLFSICNYKKKNTLVPSPLLVFIQLQKLIPRATAYDPILLDNMVFKYITRMIIYKPNRPGSVMVAIDYIKYITTRFGKDPVSLIYLGRTEWSTCYRIGPSFSLETEKRILKGYVFVFLCNQKSRIKIETKLQCFIASRIHIQGKKNLLTKKKVLTVALDAACGATIVAVSGA